MAGRPRPGSTPTGGKRIHPGDRARIAQCLAKQAKVKPTVDPKIVTQPILEPGWGRPEWRRELERARADHVVQTARTVPVDAGGRRSIERAIGNQVRDVTR